MTYVYLLWDHDEYGPENLHATLDRTKLQSILETSFNYNATDTETGKPYNDIARVALSKALLRPDEEINGISLLSGWGGVHVNAVRIE